MVRPPERDSPKHGLRLRADLDAVVRSPRRLDVGIDPHLVFKIRTVKSPQWAELERQGLEILSETSEYTYFVLAMDDGSTCAERSRRTPGPAD